MAVTKVRVKSNEDRNKVIAGRRKLFAALRIVQKQLSPTKTQSHAIIEHILNDKNNDAVAFSKSQEGKVSFARHPDGKYILNKRTVTSFQRYVRRQLRDHEIRDFHLENLANKVVNTAFDPFDKFTVVRGPEVEQRYRSFGVRSCMSGQKAINTRFYAENPEKIGLLCYHSDSQKGRAVLWTFDDGDQYVESCYTSVESVTGLFYKYAKDKGYVPYESNQLDTKAITVRPSSNGRYPYLDTFMHGQADFEKDTLILTWRRQPGSNIYFRSTRGECSVMCTDCRRYNGPRDLRCHGCLKVLPRLPDNIRNANCN